MSGLAEKFQITVPYSQKKDDDGDKWVNVKSVQVNDGVTTPEDEAKFNRLPPGYDCTCYRDDFVQ